MENTRLSGSPRKPELSAQEKREARLAKDIQSANRTLKITPTDVKHALARHCERGAQHYGERNVDKGIPQHSLIDSGVRHLSLYIQGDNENHHLVAALWNIAWALEQEIKRHELLDLPERQTGDAGTAD